MIFFHEIFGKNLTALNFGRGFIRTEAGNAGRLQRVNRAQHQRIVGCHHGEIDLIFHRKIANARDVLSADIHTNSVLGDSSVTGERVNFVDLGALFQRLNDRVLPAAATDYHNLHSCTLL